MANLVDNRWSAECSLQNKEEARFSGLAGMEM
jgi:hypothetical protein